MIDPSSADTCHALLSLLERCRPDDDDLYQAIAAHLESCATCAHGEQSLGRVLDRYCRSAPPGLPADLENRLLDLLCSKRSG